MGSFWNRLQRRICWYGKTMKELQIYSIRCQGFTVKQWQHIFFQFHHDDSWGLQIRPRADQVILLCERNCEKEQDKGHCRTKTSRESAISFPGLHCLLFYSWVCINNSIRNCVTSSCLPTASWRKSKQTPKKLPNQQQTRWQENWGMLISTFLKWQSNLSFYI